MEKIIVQNIVFPNDVCDEIGLYFRTEQEVKIVQDSVEIAPNVSVNTYTYMNLFDSSFWKKYTGIEAWEASVTAQGTGTINLWEKTLQDTKKISSVRVDSMDYRDYIFQFDSEEGGSFYFEFLADKKMYIKSGGFSTTERIHKRDIHLSVVICTYRRNQDLYHTLETLKVTKFFDEEDLMYGKMTIRVVDNASELPNDDHPFISIFHNPNTGGSGGFTRGIIETRTDEEKYGITNVVLMDDDVKVIPETFYRLYVLLRILREEYQQEVIAGRMFRLDDRKIQYTAAEIWNKGDIKHIGFQQNMCKEEPLQGVNDSRGAEYSGWWFACFPIDFVRDNTPLPFFLHCDDVEYGLRHGGTPIVLNGIQVWHETFEYRQSPVMSYYDTRNPLIVNELYGLQNDREVIRDNWIKKISQKHLEKDYLSERMIILALWDFCTYSMNNIESKNMRANKVVYRLKPINKYFNSFFWRITKKYYMTNKRRKK